MHQLANLGGVHHAAKGTRCRLGTDRDHHNGRTGVRTGSPNDVLVGSYRTREQIHAKVVPENIEIGKIADLRRSFAAQVTMVLYIERIGATFENVCSLLFGNRERQVRGNKFREFCWDLLFFRQRIKLLKALIAFLI